MDNAGLRVLAHEEISILGSKFPVDGIFDIGASTGTRRIGGAMDFLGKTSNGGVDAGRACWESSVMRDAGAGTLASAE